MIFGGLETVLGLLAPAVVDGTRKLINKWTGGVQPQTIEDLAKMSQIEVDRLKALAELDKPIGDPSQWVVDLRASFRYVAVGLMWVGTLLAVLSNAPAEIIEVLLSLCGTSLSFIIGERMLLKVSGVTKG